MCIPFVTADSVDGEISQLVSYAEQYEVGDLEYLELLVQASLIRENVNEILGSFRWDEHGSQGITAEAAEQYFGLPDGYTKKVWDTYNDEEIKLEEEVPWFEKIIFDGKRIQITFNAWPHIYNRDSEQTLYYWTDFQVHFKEEVSLDLDSALEEIKRSGNAFYQGSGSGEETSALIVAVERELRKYTEQNKGNCESIMNDLFPSGSLQENKDYERWNLVFYEGENMDVTLVANMPACTQSCQWPSINIWLNPRSDEPIDFSGSSNNGQYNRESFQDYTIEQLETELKTTLQDMQNQMQDIDNGEAAWSSLSSYESKLNALNEVLSEQYYNDEHNEDDALAFQERKSHVENILSKFGSIETQSVEELRYEHRLVENIVERQDAWCTDTSKQDCDRTQEACISGACSYALGGNEACENGVDDDGDTVADCQDPDCSIQCGTYCNAICKGECDDCRGDCDHVCLEECWQCDWNTNTDCQERCESSGCNACMQSCDEQSFCADCNSCRQSLWTQGEQLCEEECSVCTTCRDLYTTAEEADLNCVEDCTPCTQCKTPPTNPECYEACERITSSSTEQETCETKFCDQEVLFVCNGVQQYSPCEDTEYICDGQVQPFPCMIYSCETAEGIQKQTVSCGEELCGEHQELVDGACACTEGWYACDSDGACDDQTSCGGEEELCTDGLDNDNDALFDCEDIAACESQVCGENLLCYEGSCVTTDYLSQCAEGETLQDAVCRKTCALQEECSEAEYCAYGYCSTKILCTVDTECAENELCMNGYCETQETEQGLTETGQSCTLASDCFGERDICSNGICKEIPEEKYDTLVEEGRINPIEMTEPIGEQVQEVVEEIQGAPEEIPESTFFTPEEFQDSISGFVIWATYAKVITGKSMYEMSCTTEEDCRENAGCDTFRGNCYCERGFFDCNEQESDGCESSDATCGGTRELCPGGCGENQECSEETGNCECAQGFYNCDGSWWNCESTTECTPCVTNEDCAGASCSPYSHDSQVINFACVKTSSWTENKGALSFSGGCTSFPNGEQQSWIHFDTWGEPFQEINSYRANTEQALGNEWCEQEFNNALRQREEIERSLANTEFIEQLFTELQTEDMQEWETHTKAIYNMYWNIVDNTRQLARSSQCMQQEYPTLTPLQLEYEFEGGSIKVYEEQAYAQEFEMDVLTPYMRLGIFPPKELAKQELHKAAVEGHFPGEEEQAGPSVEELEEIRSDPGAMEYIRDLVSEYEDGSLDAKIVVMDEQESVFIADFSISEENLIQVKPVAVYEKEPDITVEIEFDFMYDFISEQERDSRLEHPEWVEDSLQENVGDVVDAGLTIAKITAALATGDISITPLSKVAVAVELLGHMFSGE